jgi:hypothetical protein
VGLATFALGLLQAPAAQAQSTPPAVFEKYNLIGAFAWDCSKPPARDNLYYVHRAAGPNHVQRDFMDGPGSRRSVVVIDFAAERGPNEISVAGTRDGKAIASVYRIEGNRMLVVEGTVDGQVEIAGGRFANGSPVRWVDKCSQ